MTKWYDVDMNNSKCWALYRKQMLQDLADFFKGKPTPTIVCDATFCDTFESGWFNSNKFISIYSENFESGWFDSNNFVGIYQDNFENEWFTINTFINEGNENFEDASWD